MTLLFIIFFCRRHTQELSSRNVRFVYYYYLHTATPHLMRKSIVYLTPDTDRFFFVDQIIGHYLAGKKLLAITGDKSHFVNWKDMGLKLSLPSGSLNSGDSCEIATAVFVAGKYQFPDGANVVSAIYSIGLTKPLLKPMEVWMQHCVALQPHHNTGYLSYALAPVTNHPEPPYSFKLVPGGKFFAEIEDGFYSYNETGINLICIIKMPHVITYH